ncbi:sulfotransferase family protein [Dongia deserti]|uniref:sulfotransferase family protein n=1 Tax=Dongia deserti TaxID=2268030 RepID=UPI0025491C16|nr:sulfotransferase [Dongia deserti]
MPEAPRKGFEVAPWMDRLGGFIERHTDWWIKLGSLETRLLDSTLADVRIDRPIYVTGLARSGTTILLETLARHPDVATHRYRDFPMLFTPYVWNRWLDRVPCSDEAPAERSHGDGIAVTSESPEAFEEPLWMAFFAGQHDPSVSAVLDRNTHQSLFERFYRDHIRKLLAVRGRRRYAAKGNYNVTRIGYLATLFPDARFIVPVRDPTWHVASLMKQHRLFLDGQRDNPPARRHLRRVGHFEFGEGRVPINVGNDAATAEIVALWRSGEEVRGWARYWAHIHHHIADLIEGDPELREAVYIVRYEDLCADPRVTLLALLSHCGLSAGSGFLQEATGRFHQPTYYRPRFSSAELSIIAEETAAAADRFGYQPDHALAQRQTAQ